MAMHRWRGYDHPTLHKMINGGPGPAASTPQTEYWDSLQTELAEIDADLNAKLGTLAASWEGGAADQAQTGLTPLQAWAADAQSGASGMRASTEYQADIVGRARAEVPEPVEVTTPAPSGWSKLAAGAALLTGNPGPAAVVVNQAQDHEAQEAAQDAASQKAVDAMDSYQSSSRFNTNTLGEFVPPPDVVVSTPEPSGGTGYAAGHFVSNFSGANGDTGTNTASYSPSTVGHFGGGSYTAPGHGGGNAQFTHPGALPGPTTPSGFTRPNGWTAPSGYVPVTGGEGPNLNYNQFTNNLNTGGGDARFNQNNNFTGNFNGSLNPTGGVSGAEGPKSGGGVNGKGGAGSSIGTPGATGESARQSGQLGRGGMSGSGGFGGAGDNVMGTRSNGAVAGKGGLGGPGGQNRSNGEDDEEEFETASYLVETDDVFGDERAVSQAVLGADE
ncbi:PPE domain-containing protein [Actinokineospora terrae]|uniref:PPE family protein n=1 Tax=Actinokineospora terrae TaxID=155974 RepID=A0A1H9VZ53_9PSEU|nr:PPE domain-containing protein [Actinokineospora terrae]SES26781.1 PPE family protein [Actinokineospora terrae]